MVASSVLDGHTWINVSGSVKAPSAPSNFVVPGNPADVVNYARQGNDLIIRMKAGQNITIKGFVEHGVSYNNLVFSQAGLQTVVDVSSALAATAGGVLPASLIVVETMGASASVTSLLGILGVAGAAGGVAAAVGAAGSDGGSDGGPDATAPTQTLIIAGAADDVNPMRGALVNGDATNDTAPELSGTLSSELATGEYIQILRNGVEVGTATVSGKTWIYADSGLVDGTSYSYTAVTVNAAGNRGPVSDPFGISVDSTAPTQTLTIVGAADDVNPVAGVLVDGGTTNDTAPELSGTLSAPLADNERVSVLRDGVEVGKATVSGTDWTYADSDLTDGTYEYTVVVVDVADNEGPASSAFGIIVDTTVPTQMVTITGAADDVNPVTGVLVNGGATNDIAPELSGTLSAALAIGEYVQVLRDGTAIGAATVSGANWTYADSGLANGASYSYTARVVDAAGNEGPASPAFAISVDTTAPAAPMIVQMSDDFGTFGDFATSASATILSGRAEAGSIVEVLVDGTLAGTVVADESGIWQSPSIDLSGLAAGETATVTATATDAAGNVSGATSQVVTKAATEGLSFVYPTSSLSPDQGFVILGDAEGDMLGWSVASAGDVNGDGIDDLIVGAPNSGSGGIGAGAAYVVFGTTQGFGTSVGDRMVIDTTTLSASQGFVIQGDTASDTLGVSVSSAGDVNGDGINDLVVGANGGGDGGDYAGEAYVIFGTTAGFGSADANGRMVIDTTTLTAGQGFIIQGDTAGDFFGNSVSSAGDVNGDGIDDLFVGANNGSDGGGLAGEAYVIFGTTAGFGAADGNGRMVIDTTTLTAGQGFIIQGDTAGDVLGNSVSSAGDVNGDGIDDLIVGAVTGDDGGTASGEAYVIFGTTAGFGTADGNGRMVVDTTTLSAGQGFIIQGDTASDFFGSWVSSAGDVNGDGIDDLIVGAVSGDDGGNASGEAYVIFGTTQGFGTADGNGRMVIDTTTLSASQGFIIQGDTAGDNLGMSVSSAGDMNGDGIDDLIVGAYQSDHIGNNSGTAYIIYGGDQGFGAVDAGGRMVIDVAALTVGQGFLIEGSAANDRLGLSVSAAGDVNNDGYEDVIVGASRSNGSGGVADAAYVIYGHSTASTNGGRVETGTSGADFIAGTSFEDHLTGNGGADVLLGYDGDDTIVVLDTSFARIDGGAGSDKLLLSGSGLHLDFNALGQGVVTGIEAIDITGAGNNTLTLTAQDVLDLSSTTDTLIIDGNAGDTVSAGGFTDTNQDETVGSTTYNVYTNGVATIWLDQEITNVVV